jgi:hypothetical protein
MVLIPLLGIAVMVVWILFYAYALLWLFSCGTMVEHNFEIPGGTVVGSYMSYVLN